MSLEWYTPPIVSANSIVTAEGQLDTASEVLPSNPIRKKVILQNVGTAPIYVFLGPEEVSASNFSFVLHGGSAEADGRGGAFIDEVYNGAIQALGATEGAVLRIVEL